MFSFCDITSHRYSCWISLKWYVLEFSLFPYFKNSKKKSIFTTGRRLNHRCWYCGKIHSGYSALDWDAKKYVILNANNVLCGYLEYWLTERAPSTWSMSNEMNKMKWIWKMTNICITIWDFRNEIYFWDTRRFTICKHQSMTQFLFSGLYFLSHYQINGWSAILCRLFFRI